MDNKSLFEMGTLIISKSIVVLEEVFPSVEIPHL